MVQLSETKALIELAKALHEAPRMGADVDSPEGSRYIQISDTLAKQLEKELMLGIVAISQVMENMKSISFEAKP